MGVIIHEVFDMCQAQNGVFSPQQPRGWRHAHLEHHGYISKGFIMIPAHIHPTTGHRIEEEKRGANERA